MLDLLIKRRSIRKFKTTEIEKEKVDKLIKAALLSPSSRDLKPWNFIIIDDKNIIIELSKCKKHGSDFLKNAPFAAVITADPETCDVWIEDASIASIIIQLEAESLGLSSCWIQVRERTHDNGEISEEYVKKILFIPDKYRILCIIAIGYKDEDLPPSDTKKLKFDKIFINKFDNIYKL